MHFFTTWETVNIFDYRCLGPTSQNLEMTLKGHPRSHFMRFLKVRYRLPINCFDPTANSCRSAVPCQLASTLHTAAPFWSWSRCLQHKTKGGSAKSATARKRLDRLRCCFVPDVPIWKPCQPVKRSWVYLSPFGRSPRTLQTDRRLTGLWQYPLIGLPAMSLHKLWWMGKIYICKEIGCNKTIECNKKGILPFSMFHIHE